MLRILALLLISPLALATDLPWYRVEIVVFARLGDAGLQEEVWRDEARADVGNAYDLAALRTAGASLPGIESGVGAMQRLPPEALQLGPIWNNLKRSAGYRPLLHAGWIQPGFNRDQAVPLRITTGGATPAPYAFTPPQIDGTVRVYLERYLHAETDLVFYRAPGDGELPPPPGQDEVLPSSLFRLNEKRRMRLDELHYLDHPLFGVLIQIGRYAPAPAPAAAFNPAFHQAAR